MAAAPPAHMFRPPVRGRGLRAGVFFAVVTVLTVLARLEAAEAQTQSPPAEPSPATVVYGGNNSSPPFEYLDAGGNPQGFSVELFRALTRVSGRQAEFRLGVWKDIVTELDQGGVDVVTLGYAEERTRQFDFLVETWTLRQAAFFRPGRPNYPGGPGEMHGETVAVQLNSIVHEILRSLPEPRRPKILAAANHLEAAQLFLSGRATTVAGNSLVLRTALEDRLPNAVEVPIQAASYQLATARGRGPEMAWIAPALQRLKDSGEYSRLVEKHLAVRGRLAFWPILGGALAAALLVGSLALLGARVWNASLRRQVAARTTQLQAMVEEKERLAASVAEREQRLRISEERYELAARASQDVIWDRDFAAKRVVWSAGLAALGYPAPSSDEAGVWWRDKVHPDDRERTMAAFQAAIDGHEERFDATYRLRRADGTYAHVTDRAIVMRDAAGQPVRMIGAMTDVTARREAEAERERLIADLEAKNAELERFTYTVSHDLKSPLVTIGAYVGQLEKSARDGDMERLTGDIARIERAAARMRRLLDELLDLSRVGRVMNPPDLVSLGDLAREAADLLKGRLSAHQIDITISPGLPSVRGDRVRLLEVMLNLLDNAAKFAGEGQAPRIEVGIAADRPAPSFFVRDNGIGIDPQHHERVFGLFDKLDSASEGTGVGLALVRRIVQAHGGEITIESPGQGRGTTFHVTFPPPAPAPS